MSHLGNEWLARVSFYEYGVRRQDPGLVAISNLCGIRSNLLQQDSMILDGGNQIPVGTNPDFHPSDGQRDTTKRKPGIPVNVQGPCENVRRKKQGHIMEEFGSTPFTKLPNSRDAPGAYEGTNAMQLLRRTDCERRSVVSDIEQRTWPSTMFSSAYHSLLDRCSAIRLA